MRTIYDRSQLNDLAFSNSKEFLAVAAKGNYAAGTIAGCNTRKYHGLVVALQPQIDEDHHVLLASLDETLIDGDHTYDLSIHKYPNIYAPDGTQYMASFTAQPIPSWTFECGENTISKELQIDDEGSLTIRYTLTKANGPLVLRLHPLLAFRNMHWVRRADEHADKTVHYINDGISMQLYPQYSSLFLQMTGDAVFKEAGYWYYNVEYPIEQERGYEYQEDLYGPGYFEVTLHPGLAVIFSGAITERQQLVCRAPKPVTQTTKEYLLKAASQFVIHTSGGLSIKAGYYWFGSWGRDTCISLPGLTFLAGNPGAFSSIMSLLRVLLKDGLLPNTGNLRDESKYATVDASMWFVWALQQYAIHEVGAAAVWNIYGDLLKDILYHYRYGTAFNIHMEPDGMISAAYPGKALTWMDAVILDTPITQRPGKPVEVNALWYNAVCFCVNAARDAGDNVFVQEWSEFPALIATGFVKCFWDDNHQYLADVVHENIPDWSIRPNQIFAVALPYSPLNEVQQNAVVAIVKRELLTPRGLRTLSPQDPNYIGHYGGSQLERDHAYHQGTVWPWLLAHYAAAVLKTAGDAGKEELKELFSHVESALEECCLYSIPEVYNGDAPHAAGGTVAQAWSVAEFIRFERLISGA
ncbi:amylo-alpha-1,6-glucosidase [Chitinophaga sp. LS1]|uniref:amylo-alpha-1,6-glucosidase n=1 Tax=Chitinophaga sp. LS1 TaxID=3051176 RepID=UPI002AAA7D35|nr:amylo-alpha-1,6-glucosidase [Chitinophaga sp. LS1]WPV64871.1 amylo-alpha-1,6-glucosidase [Chitinophaga sp. LS1]